MQKEPAKAFSRLDLLVIIATVGVLIMWATSGGPRIWRQRTTAKRVHCAVNLKQIAFGYSVWEANNNLTNFPWEIPAPIGTAAYAKSSNVFLHFTILSNEIQNLRLLTCPADVSRRPARSWSQLRNDNISYFINFTASRPVTSVISTDVILGDPSLSTNDTLLSGHVVISNPTSLSWSKSIHTHGGNVAMADGSAHQIGTSAVRQLFTNTPIHLVFP